MNALEQRYEQMLEPTPLLVNDMAPIKGDILLLGAGGKMGPALALLAKKAVEAAGGTNRIIAVSRFSGVGLRKELEENGIETIAIDLLDENALDTLPDAENVLYLAGVKFGTSDKPAFTWAMNGFLPGLVARRYRNARIVVFSSGNVYPLTPVLQGGATETCAPEPSGEYAQSCLARERMFQFGSMTYGTPILIYRLNYANDVTYGVLLELAKAVKDNRPIDLSMGHVNVIWQKDANEWALRCLLHCSEDAPALNITGPETASVRWIAHCFGKRFGREPLFSNQEQPTALLSNAALAASYFGYPQVTLTAMIDIVADWLLAGGKTINKATHFQERNGKY